MGERIHWTHTGEMALRKICNLERVESLQEAIDSQLAKTVSLLDESYSKGVAPIRGRRNRDAFSRGYVEFAKAILSAVQNLDTDAVGYDGAMEALETALLGYADKFRR